jgi:hypothetical protein
MGIASKGRAIIEERGKRSVKITLYYENGNAFASIDCTR